MGSSQQEWSFETWLKDNDILEHRTILEAKGYTKRANLRALTDATLLELLPGDAKQGDRGAIRAAIDALSTPKGGSGGIGGAGDAAKPLPQFADEYKICIQDIQDPKLLQALNNLSNLYDNYKAGTFATDTHLLPNLGVLPKNMPSLSVKLMVREIPLSLFSDLESWDQARMKPSSSYIMPYGKYLAGPNGIGKSVSLYTLACLAKAKGWIVVYIPLCDEWIARSDTQKNIYEYFLQHFALAIATNNFYNNKTIARNLKMCKTWGDLVVYGTTVNALEAVTAIIAELAVCTDHPVLLVFDEVNALYEMAPSWTDKLAYTIAPFSYMAATLNRLTMKRGWKVITGTGHERFINAAPPGLLTESMMCKLGPWNDDDFLKLLVSDISHPLITSLLATAAIKKVVQDILLRCTGRVPRQLQQLHDMISNDTKIGIDNYFNSAPETSHIKSPIARLQHFVNKFNKSQETHFFNIHQSYYDELPHEDRRQFLTSMLDILVEPQKCVVVGWKYMDKNLLYVDSKFRHFPITHAAGRAILAHVRTKPDILGNVVVSGLSAAENSDEAAIPFEQAFKRALLLAGDVTLHTTKIDGSDPRATQILCQYSIEFGFTPKDVIDSGRLFQHAPDNNTLLNPPPKYPVADLLYVNTHQAIIFQISLQKLLNKVPNNGNSYTAIYDDTKWRNINMLAGSGQNFVECLVHSVCGEDTCIRIQDKDLVVTKPSQFSVEYIIVSPRTIPALNATGWPEIKTCANTLPWVRVLSKTTLRKLLGDFIVDKLEKMA